MKKLYSLLAATAVALSATAVVPSSLLNAELAGKWQVENSTLQFRTGSFSKKSTPVKVASRATDYNALTWKEIGKGKFKPSALVDTYGLPEEMVDVTISEAQEVPGVYILKGTWPSISEETQLLVDASDPNYVMIPPQYIGLKDQVDGETILASKSAVYLTNEGVTKEDVIKDYPEDVLKLINGNVSFPEGSLVLCWPNAPANGQYGTDPNSWYAGNSKTAGHIVLPGYDYVDPWTSLGTGKFTENIIYASFTRVENTEAADVDVFVSTANPNLYKVKEAFKALFNNLGATVSSPELVLNAKDPSNIIIDLQTTKINGGDVDGEYYILSQSAYYDMQNNSTADDTPEELRIKLTKEGEKTTVTFPVQSTCLLASGSNQLYYGSPYVSTLTFNQMSGVEGVTVADENAPVEYYNLQGVKVANPESGLYIRRQGNTATKVLIK